MQPNNVFTVWLKERGITDEVMALFGLSVEERPDIGECLRIPFGTEGYAKYRRHPLDDRKPKYLYDKGAKVTLFGADQIFDLKGGPVLITEGELDALVAWSQNIPAVSSTGGALSFQKEWASAFLGHQVYVCFDNDDTGAEGAVKVLDVLPNSYVVLVPETPGVKDISDYVQRGGDLHDLLKTAKQYVDVVAVEEDKKARKATWQSTRFHDKYLAKHRERHEHRSQSRVQYVGDDKVLRAKAFPMDSLIKFTGGKALCPWHNEKTPSLTYYPKSNSCYCFGGCGKVYDSIDAYMKVHNVSFTKAVEDLNKLV